MARKVVVDFQEPRPIASPPAGGVGGVRVVRPVLLGVTAAHLPLLPPGAGGIARDRPDGRRVLDATVGGKCPVFERVAFDALFETSDA